MVKATDSYYSLTCFAGWASQYLHVKFAVAWTDIICRPRSNLAPGRRGQQRTERRDTLHNGLDTLPIAAKQCRGSRPSTVNRDISRKLRFMGVQGYQLILHGDCLYGPTACQWTNLRTFRRRISKQCRNRSFCCFLWDIFMSSRPGLLTEVACQGRCSSSTGKTVSTSTVGEVAAASLSLLVKRLLLHYHCW